MGAVGQKFPSYLRARKSLQAHIAIRPRQLGPVLACAPGSSSFAIADTLKGWSSRPGAPSSLLSEQRSLKWILEEAPTNWLDQFRRVRTAGLSRAGPQDQTSQTG